MRLAGYDWVPEAELTRSLWESWQRDTPGYMQNMQIHLQINNCVYNSGPSGTEVVLGVLFRYCICELLP